MRRQIGTVCLLSHTKFQSGAQPLDRAGHGALAHGPGREARLTFPLGKRIDIAETFHMRHSKLLILLTAFLPSLLLVPLAGAQVPRSDQTFNLAQAERAVSDLKPGMSVDEVQKLLGKPPQTELSGSPNALSKGTLQWTYTWASSSAQSSLRVEFASQPLEEWHVNSWEWLTR